MIEAAGRRRRWRSTTDSVPRVGRKPLREQPVERDRAADLVAVGERLQQDVRAARSAANVQT